MEQWITSPVGFLFTHARRIVEFAAQSRLPAMYHDRLIVQAGGLMSYDVNRPDITRRLSFYVDQIFHGAKRLAQQAVATGPAPYHRLVAHGAREQAGD